MRCRRLNIPTNIKELAYCSYTNKEINERNACCWFNDAILYYKIAKLAMPGLFEDKNRLTTISILTYNGE